MFINNLVKDTGILFLILSLIIKQALCSCTYLSSTTIISLSDPELTVDTKLDSTIINAQKNVGYGLWMKYQPFTPISEIINTSSKGGPSAMSSSTINNEFIYLLQQKESKFNILIVYTIIDSSSIAITHQVYYSFQTKTGTLSFDLNSDIYEGKWILFYMFCNQVSGSTTFGFYQSDLTTPLLTTSISDIPSFTKYIRHTLGGTQEFQNQLGANISLTQYKGRLSNIFSEEETNIFSDISSFLSNCPTIYTCITQEISLTAANQQMYGDTFNNFIASIIEQQIYVLNGWVKLDLLTQQSLATVIFRITINKGYSDDMNIGDKVLYLKYNQNVIPANNGFELTTYTYKFPISDRYTSSGSDIISITGPQYLQLLTHWHYIQYEIGTLNNNGKPLFTIYFPSLPDAFQYQWTETIIHFTGSKFYITIGGDNFSKNYMSGYFSSLTLTTYCSSPTTTLTVQCHYSCNTCDGPNLNNCLTCPNGSSRIQSTIQKTCTCQNNYIDIDGNPICQAVAVIFPSLSLVEQELSCPYLGYAQCQNGELKCKYGYFEIDGFCIQCPEYLNIDNTYVGCASCLFYPEIFGQSLKCDFDLLTYDVDSLNSFHHIPRDSNQTEVYQTYQYFDGSYYLVLQKGFIDSFNCREGYVLRNDQCLSCLPGCQICNEIFYCQTCDIGYSLTANQECQQCQGCSTCSLVQSVVTCSNCPSGMYLSNGSCYTCGQNCAHCSTTGYCYYCEDSSKYFITFDAFNCHACDIANCLYCYHYYIQDSITYTTLDIAFPAISLKSVELLVGCALCSTNLYFNQITLQCENKPVTAPPVSIITDPSNFGGGNTGGGGGSSGDDSCTFGLITDSSGTTHCLISSNSKSSTQLTSCSSITNCAQCIENYSSSTTFCIVCVDGFYSAILTGQCIQCSSNCRTCTQQNTLYHDYWKWEVKAYYKYVFNNDDSHPFETYATSTTEIDFSIVCTSCPLGYILYQQACILDCNDNCSECQIRNGLAVCLQCQQTPNGYLKSQTSKGICQTCPNYCSACQERTSAEIVNVNPYFIVTDQNLRYTKICYERFDVDLSSGYYFYDQLVKTYTVCSANQNCYNNIILSYNLYCSESEFNSTTTDQNNPSEFLLKNNYINNLFTTTYLDQVETSGLFTYLNEKVVRQVTFQYTIIQGNAAICQLQSLSSITTMIQQNVFALESVNIQFIGQSYPTKLSLNDSITISNFTTITFKNIQFDISKQSQSVNNISKIILYNLKSKLVLELIKCDFTTNNSTNTNYSFQFTINQQYSLIISDLKITNFQVYDSNIFSFTHYGQSQTVQIHNLIIENSYFFNSVFLYFSALTAQLECEVSLISTTMVNTQFKKSVFILAYSELIYNVGSINVTTILLNSITLQDKSSIYNISSANSFRIFNQSVINSQLSGNSYYQKSNIIQCTRSYFNNIILLDSHLISNNVAYPETGVSLSNSSLIIIINITLSQISYNLQQSVMQLLYYSSMGNFQALISLLYLDNCIYTLSLTTDYISYDQSIIYIECQTCILKDIAIQRGNGLPEISILNSNSLQISNFTIIQAQQYHSKTLHQQFDCVSKFAYVQQFFILFIGNYQDIAIDGLAITSCIAFNTPFIILKGYNLIQTTQTEKLSITNSKFSSNMLIISKSNRETGVISISSEQSCNIQIKNLTFTDNHLNEYFQDLTRLSAATLLFQLQQGTVSITNSYFRQNIVTNSTDSILFIKSNVIHLSRTQFYSNNILNFSLLSQNILLSLDQFSISTTNLESIFDIKSKSGNGMLVGTTIILNFIIVNQSYSLSGGGFYLNTQGEGNVTISNSKFANTQTSLVESSFSSGGCLYIDASLSKFTFIMSNSIIDTSYSRLQGGGIRILPSQTLNYVELNTLTIINCFSLSTSFFSYQLSKLTSIQSTVVMKNIEFYASQEGFHQFLSLVETLSDAIVTIQSNNPMILIQYGNVTLQNCSFLSTHIMYLLQIEAATNIVLQDIQIKNATILYSPLMTLNLRQQQQGHLLINNFKVSNLQQYTKFSNQKCLSTSAQAAKDLTCPSFIPSETLILENDDKSTLFSNQLSCNKYSIYASELYQFSLIEIDSLNQTHKIKISGLSFENNNCTQCNFGLFRILGIYPTHFVNIFFNNIELKNNICGQTGCLSLLQYYTSSVIRSDLLSNSRLLQQHDYDAIENTLTYQIYIKNSTFINNSATYGGALLIVELSTIIRDCLFANNTADIGGSIYYFSKTATLDIFESQFVENSAKIAGGLYLNSQSLQQTQQLDVVISNNKSTLFGPDIFESPRSLTISVDGGTTFLQVKTISYTNTTVIEQIIVKPYKILGYSEKANFLTFPSGREIGKYQYFDQYTSNYIPYNLTFRVIALNKYQTQEKSLAGSYCTLSPKAVNSSSGVTVDSLTASLSYSKVSFNTTSGDFNLDDLIIYFNPTNEADIVLRLTIICNMISIPQYNNTPPYIIENYITNYYLYVDIKTFPCQLGEFLNSTSGGCILCDTVQNQYQVVWSASSCSYKDDVRMKSIESSMIELRATYWRAYYYSQTIESCYHLSANCDGGWQPGDGSCIDGHIGALCEQCDLYNTRGNGSYSTSDQYSCGSCDEVVGNVLTIFFISIWTLISILMSVSSTIEMIEEFIVGLRLKAFGVTVVIKQASTAILIKVFTNYLQIISTISTFQLTVPAGLASVVNSVGNPIQSMAYSLDCFLISVSDILIIYFRIIWSLLLATSYISVFFSLYSIAIVTKSVKFNFSFITTALIFVYIYLQPNIIGGLISLISFRIISDEYWIQGNVAYRYDTFQHAKWLIGFCLPLLLTIGGIIPVFLWYGVHKNRKKLDVTKTRQIWGYLYNEYKLHAYYWETVKILQKEMIIIVLAYYEDHIPIKASLVFLFLFAYSFLTTNQKPYMTGFLNHLDSQSTVFCAVSIILGSSIYTAQQSNLQEIVWPFYIMIGIINAIFIIKMLIIILFAYFDKLHDQIDKVKELIIKYFPNFINKHPFVQELFESRRKQQTRVRERFAKIKQHLFVQAKQILQFKKQNNLDLPNRIRTELSMASDRQNELQKSQIMSVNSPIDANEKDRLRKTARIYQQQSINDASSVDHQDHIEQLVLQKPQSSKVYPEVEIGFDVLKMNIQNKNE